MRHHHLTIEAESDYALWRALQEVADYQPPAADKAPYRVTHHVEPEPVEGPFEGSVEAAPVRMGAWDDWIAHDALDECPGGPMPVHPLDMVHCWRITPMGRPEHLHSGVADKAPWARVSHYRHDVDEDGIPYVWDDGSLEPWAEYVATDESGETWQYKRPPIRVHRGWDYDGDESDPAPDHYANTRDHWTDTLRRVWRER